MMKVLRIVVLVVIGLSVSYAVGLQNARAEGYCPDPIACDDTGLPCGSYDYFCDLECGPQQMCLWRVGRCFWPDGPICSTVYCSPGYYC